MYGLRVVVWGFVATLVLTTVSTASQGLGLSRMNMPYLMGSIFTPDRDKAKVIGLFLHILNGWAFAFLYAVIFLFFGGPSIWKGAIMGAAHAGVVLVLGMSLLPSFHPRMANELQGPTVTRRLEPPGFMGLHYGYQTPLTVLVAHVIYGLILGAFL
jgi:uncharacterized membrane protein YagU involved in acid resistance